MEGILDGDARRMVLVLKQRLLKFKSVLSAQNFLRIFELRTPLSKYLQTKGMDVLKSHQMVMKIIVSLEEISRNFTDVKTKQYLLLLGQTKNWRDSGVVENELSLPRTRRQMLSGGTVSDQENLYEVNVHNVVLDTVISFLKTRFNEHGNLFVDLSCLDPNNFSQIKNLPETAFEKVSSKVIRFNANATPSAIRKELLDFASRWVK